MAVHPVGATTFDPGTSAFGIYGQFAAVNNRVVYMQDARNTWETVATQRHHVRFFGGAWRNRRDDGVPDRRIGIEPARLGREIGADAARDGGIEHGEIDQMHEVGMNRTCTCQLR